MLYREVIDFLGPVPTELIQRFQYWDAGVFDRMGFLYSHEQVRVYHGIHALPKATYSPDAYLHAGHFGLLDQ